MKASAEMLKRFRDARAKEMLIKDSEDLSKRVFDEMATNFTRSQQHLAGKKVSNSIVGNVESGAVPTHYSYLYRKDLETGKGLVHTHVIYDYVVADDGKVIEPKFAGFFQTEVDLKNYDGMIRNPMYCKSAAEYLRDNWLNQPAFWCLAVINLLRLGCGMSIFSNNQHSEGVMKQEKKLARKDRYYHCSEPALYLLYAWKKDREASRRFMRDAVAVHVKVMKKQMKRNLDVSVFCTSSGMSYLVIQPNICFRTLRRSQMLTKKRSIAGRLWDGVRAKRLSVQRSRRLKS